MRDRGKKRERKRVNKRKTSRGEPQKERESNALV